MSLTVSVKSEPKGEAKGQFQCAISEDGITLTQKKKRIQVPIGADVEYLGKNRLQVQFDEYRLEITVAKLGSYQNLLARDLADFLQEGGEPPILSDYRLPWYFYVVSVLPIGIPIITLGGAIPGAIGFGLAAGCFAIAQQEEMPTAGRLALMIGLVAVAYIGLFLILAKVLG